ncbi:hypothetical protein ACWPKO_03795 [Coraliomargarita sp. W4R53]
MNTSDGIHKSIGRLRALALFSVAAFAALSLNAAAPTAGTSIGNQASATYKDQNGTDRETTSNTVVTTVLQIPGLALTQDNTRTVSPGGSVFLPHTLTNTGNGTDSFDLFTDTITGDFTLGALVIYADTNRDGQPDDITSPIITTDDLAPGESFYFVVGTSVPGAATDGQTAGFNINGTSDFSETLDAGDPLLDLTVDNTDTINVSEDAVITVTKLIDQAEGVPGTTPVKYTLSYNNTGNTAATSVTLTDEIPANMTYIADSGLSSLTGSTVLTDDDDGTVAGGSTTVEFKYEAAVGPNGTMTVVIGTVPAGASGTVSFTVSVDEDIAPQIIYNEAKYTYDPDGPTGPKDPPTPITTNRPPFEVLPEPSVTLDGDTVDEARPGETVVFNNLLTNTGNTTDTFDMTIISSTSSYPTGTTFVFYQADGNTPMVDTNGNGIPDTGPVAGVIGGGTPTTYNVVVKAKLPTNINLTTFPGPYAVDKRATGSVNDVNGSPATDDATDTVTTILPPTVDITNATSAQDPDDGTGDGAGVDGDDFTTDPGATVIIPLTVENEGNIPDAYNLTVDPNTIPDGWIVNIRKVAGGTFVNNTGTLDAPATAGDDGESYSYIAEVIVPAGEEPGDNDITFIATSPTSGASDTIVNTVTVNTVREIGLISDNAGQISPGGSIVYEHIISNLGNVTEAVTGAAITLTLSDSKVAEGWTSVIYLDANDNGVLDASDPVVTQLVDPITLGIAGSSDDSERLFVKVFAPLGAPDAAINITTITATPSGVINTVAAPDAVSNEDTTTVILGDVVLLKEQALDADNNGVADGAFTVLPQSAKPGESILYRVTATNTGSADATNIVIYDTTPTATTYAPANTGLAVAYVSGGTVNTVDAVPAAGASGSLEFNVGTLAPGDSATVGFGVKIND